MELLLMSIFFPVCVAIFMYYWYRLPVSPSATFFSNLLVGHRGSNMSKHPEKFDQGFPENTLSAMRYAMERGVDAIEFDITLSQDNVPVIMHDETVTRMCVINDPQREAPKNFSERVSRCTVDQLQRFFRYRNDKAFINKETEREPTPSHKIPTLREALDLTQKNDLGRRFKLMIEVKSCSDDQKMAEALCKLFDEYDLYDLAVVGSFHPWALYCVRRHNPRIVTLLLVAHNSFMKTWNPLVLFEQIQEHLLYLSVMSWLPSFLGVGVIGFDRRLYELAKFNVDQWFARGYVLNCWTVNSEKQKKALCDKKVSVTTDFLFRSE